MRPNAPFCLVGAAGRVCSPLIGWGQLLPGPGTYETKSSGRSFYAGSGQLQAALDTVYAFI